MKLQLPPRKQFYPGKAYHFFKDFPSCNLRFVGLYLNNDEDDPQQHYFYINNRVIKATEYTRNKIFIDTEDWMGFYNFKYVG